MLTITMMALFAAQSDAPVCRDVNVAQANGTSRTVLMCKGGDGQWRPADLPASTSRAAPATAAERAACNPQEARKSGFGLFLGKMAQDVMGSAATRMKLPISAQTRYSFNQLVSDAIACRLRPGERTQAASATDRVVTKKVGTSVGWSSSERPGVTGSSTVTAQTALADGSVCKDVRDVATIDGEETAVTKRMCRAPGASGFTVVKSA